MLSDKSVVAKISHGNIPPNWIYRSICVWAELYHRAWSQDTAKTFGPVWRFVLLTLIIVKCILQAGSSAVPQCDCQLQEYRRG